MNHENELAVAILTELDSIGYLKHGVRTGDETLLPRIATVIRARAHAHQAALAGFITWWARAGHEQHDTAVGVLPTTWQKCANPLCLSLMGTLAELPALPDPAVDADKPASPCPSVLTR